MSEQEQLIQNITREIQLRLEPMIESAVRKVAAECLKDAATDVLVSILTRAIKHAQ